MVAAEANLASSNGQVMAITNQSPMPFSKGNEVIANCGRLFSLKRDMPSESEELRGVFQGTAGSSLGGMGRQFSGGGANFFYLAKRKRTAKRMQKVREAITIPLKTVNWCVGFVLTGVIKEAIKPLFGSA